MIKRHSSDMAGLRPELVAHLAGIAPDASKHVDLGLRSPRSSYNASLQDVTRAFIITLDALDDLVDNKHWLHKKDSWDHTFVDAYERLLYTMFEHLNHCRNIVVSLLPPNAVVARDHRVKAYDRSIKDYRDVIALIVNRVKHNQRRVRGFVMYNDAVWIPGYFIESVGALGPKPHAVIQPDPEIHPRSDTAISSHRDLRFHFGNIYGVAKSLNIAVGRLTSVNPVAHRLDDQEIDQRLFEIATRITRLPLFFFPDELRKPVPAVGANEGLDGRTIWVEYPSNRLKPMRLNNSKMTISFMGDGETDIFKIPYAYPETSL